MRQLLAPTGKYNYYFHCVKNDDCWEQEALYWLYQVLQQYIQGRFYLTTVFFGCSINNDVSDHAAQKVSAIQNQGTSALKNVVAAKDTTLSAASAALEASAEADHHNAAAAWAPSAKVVHVSQWG